LAGSQPPQVLTRQGKRQIYQQLHPVNHEYRSSPQLSLFWNFGAFAGVPAMRLYPFLKSRMRFFGGQVHEGWRVENIA
jgi:hypothetical protein